MCMLHSYFDLNVYAQRLKKGKLFLRFFLILAAKENYFPLCTIKMNFPRNNRLAMFAR